MKRHRNEKGVDGLNTLQVEYLAVEELTAYDKNARTHNPKQLKQLCESIRQFGFTNPVLVDENNELIAGHGRTEAAKRLGMTSVPAIRLSNLTPTQVKALRIADNQLALNAGWDTKLLAAELEEIKLDDFDMSVIGFSDSDLDKIIEYFSPGTDDSDEGDDDIDDDDADAFDTEDESEAEPAQEPGESIVRRGDIFLLGEHRVMCGDSTSSTDVAKLMGGDRAELLFTSPPYAEMRDYNGDKNLDTGHLSNFIAAYEPFVRFQAVNLGLTTKDNEILTYWDDYLMSARSAGLKLLAWNVWDKGSPKSVAQNGQMFGMRHEWIFVFGREKKLLNKVEVKSDRNDRRMFNTLREKDGSMKINPVNADSLPLKRPTSVHAIVPIVSNTERAEVEGHPAAFPKGLPRFYIDAMTEKGDIVVDSFSGAGTTMMACEETGRIYRGMELDPHFLEISLRRYQKTTGREAVREADGKTYSELKKEANEDA